MIFFCFCSYDCHNGHWSPGGSVCLHLNLLKYIYAIGSRGNVKVNEIAGACHTTSKSKHYKGRAADISIRGQYGTRKKEYMNSCRTFGGVPFDETSHIHCQMN
ncbi:Hypothetical predicted protein [Mytilus galloprovincialis]|uniref:Peptidase M15A C-terminal domain-containing protein n=1 Tax=Mytilus galloprovincialis TaxID=29158 RepID=A0A8B6GEN5_MYTGA|nr:Hypothetical predicted protein [Mytilus galloprovincialis]